MLADSCFCKIQTPKFIGIPSFSTTHYCDPIYLRETREGIINSKSSVVLDHEKLYIGNKQFTDINRLIIHLPELFEYKSNFIIAKKSKPINIKNGIFVGGAGSCNWYHFIFECLTKVYLSRMISSKYDDFPLLVPEEWEINESFRVALNIFKDNRNVFFMNSNEYYNVDNLIWLDDISIGPFNNIYNSFPSIYEYSYHSKLLKSYIDELKFALLGNDIHLSNHDRIFLSRPNTIRNYNQPELIEIAKRFGFREISMEKLNLREQAREFSQASFIIGPSGSAWWGLIFGNSPKRCLSWLPSEYMQFCAYSSLAELSNHDLRFIHSQPNESLHSTMHGYNATYHVNPVIFENSLKNLFY